MEMEDREKPREALTLEYRSSLSSGPRWSAVHLPRFLPLFKSAPRGR
jgi:hypothetical protein